MFAIPLAWLQLTREKIRLLVALAGIAFAVILMFMQLGFRDALFDSSVRFHESLKGDIFLVSPQSTALIGMRSFSDRRLQQARGFEGVESVTPIYLDIRLWKNPETRRTRGILIIGIDPAAKIFDDEIFDDDLLAQARKNKLNPDLAQDAAQDLSRIQMADVVLFDQSSRQEFGNIAELYGAYKAGKGPPVNTEVGGRWVTVQGLFSMGASFGADGNIITSDLNFIRIFGSAGNQGRQAGLIDVGLVKVKPGVDVKALVESLRGADLVESELCPKENYIKTLEKQGGKTLPEDVLILSKREFVACEQDYWKSGTAIGFIFSLGTAMGFIVGIVIVYQILYTDVSDHLPEYATLKAMGYKNFYLFSVVFQEALILSVVGYIPGFLLCLVLYNLTQNATSLPVAMTLERALTVFTLTIIMCCVSATIAVRKAQSADPADIF